MIIHPCCNRWYDTSKTVIEFLHKRYHAQCVLRSTFEWHIRSDVLSGFCEYQNDCLKGLDSVSGPGLLGDEFHLDNSITIHHKLPTATYYLSNRWQNFPTRAELIPITISNGWGLLLSFLLARVCKRDGLPPIAQKRIISPPILALIRSQRWHQRGKRGLPQTPHWRTHKGGCCHHHAMVGQNDVCTP